MSTDFYEDLNHRLASDEFCASESEECDWCCHPAHGSTPCEHDRTIEADGIEIDGPCGCIGDSDVRDTIAAKRKVEHALFMNGGLRNFPSERRMSFQK